MKSPPMASNFIDDKLNDPDFNPFETKTKMGLMISDGISSPDDLPALEICEKPEVVEEINNKNSVKSPHQVKKDSTPEFEQAEKLINNASVSGDPQVKPEVRQQTGSPFNKLEKMISEDSMTEQSLLPDIPYDDNQESGLTESSFHLSTSVSGEHIRASDPFSPNIQPLSSHQPSMKKVTENVVEITTTPKAAVPHLEQR